MCLAYIMLTAHSHTKALDFSGSLSVDYCSIVILSYTCLIYNFCTPCDSTTLYVHVCNYVHVCEIRA